MKNEKMYDGITGIREEFIEQAENYFILIENGVFLRQEDYIAIKRKIQYNYSKISVFRLKCYIKLRRINL